MTIKYRVELRETEDSARTVSFFYRFETAATVAKLEPHVDVAILEVRENHPSVFLVYQDENDNLRFFNDDVKAAYEAA